MSKLNFESFKLAFRDPDARVKLNSDINNKFPHSSIDKIKISMGYLDNLSLDLSSNLNTIIGGRGTGKSTLIELIRYALDIAPTSQNTNNISITNIILPFNENYIINKLNMLRFLIVLKILQTIIIKIKRNKIYVY